MNLSFWKLPWPLNELCTPSAISAGHPCLSTQRSHTPPRTIPQLTSLVSAFPPGLERLALMSPRPHTVKIQQAGQDIH